MSRAVEDRVLRTVGMLFGVGGAVFGLLTLPTILGQLDATPAWWTVSALVATLGLPIALGLTAPFAGARTIRVLGGVVAAGNLLAMVTDPLVAHRPGSAEVSPWVLQLTGLGTTGAALGLPLAVVTVDVLLTGAVVVLDRVLTSPQSLGLIPLQDGLYAALFSAIFSALIVGAVRAGRAVDEATVEAIATTRAARDERVRTDERTRVDALVHDHVLTTLLVAARSPEPIDTVAADAEDALVRLRRLAADDHAEAAITAEELLDRLRAQLTAVAPDAAFVTDGAREAPIPVRVAEALIGATGEALRNSRRHAGPDADIEVVARLEADAVEIVVLDDGTGFVRSDVPANRLGIHTSIEGRMRRVDGTAAVRSQRGRGTAVQLRWGDR